MKFPSNIQQLTAYVNEKLSADQQITEDEALWFIAMYEARALFDSCSTKDVASMLRGGMPVINADYVDGWLETFMFDFGTPDAPLVYEISQEMIDEVGSDPFELLNAHIAYMYGEQGEEEDE